MSEYVMLEQMGVKNPGEIERYSYETINNIDILHIIYKRKKGSLLPSTKRFRFHRIENVVLVEGDARATQIHYEASPDVRKALSELEQIVNSRKDRRSKIEIIEDELNHLAEDNAARHAHIRALIKELE